MATLSSANPGRQNLNFRGHHTNYAFGLRFRPPLLGLDHAIQSLLKHHDERLQAEWRTGRLVPLVKPLVFVLAAR